MAKLLAQLILDTRPAAAERGTQRPLQVSRLQNHTAQRMLKFIYVHASEHDATRTVPEATDADSLGAGSQDAP